MRAYRRSSRRFINRSRTHCRRSYVMNKRTRLLVAFTIAAPAFAREEYTRNFDKTAALANSGRVHVAHRLGEVLIRTHQRPEVIVHAVIRASAPDMAEARRLADNIRIE